MAKALYREYRPKNFDEVLGQDRVVKVLKNQVKSSQISHAYLFSGERGCGKTSCAKIFSKAINCLNPKDGSPCGECENCKAIDKELTMDIVEMDAASNRRIDDIRNLKETVIYPPSKLKYKVYIIDEAHMITREAFNALLKIMEEPPSHLVFILATTEVDLIPKTILSRLQKFEFNRMGKSDIITQIDIILNDLDIKMDDEAKELIVSKAKGAMRDALSILDQVLSINLKEFNLKNVESILGIVDKESIDILLDKIIGFNQKDALDMLFKLRENSKDNLEILDALTSYLREIMIYKVSENAKNISSIDYMDKIRDKANKISYEKILAYLETINDYSVRFRNSYNTSLLMEMLILRLINFKDEKNLVSRIESLESQKVENIIDIINRLVEEKLSNLDLLSINSKNIKKEKIEKEKQSQNYAYEKVDKKSSKNFENKSDSNENKKNEFYPRKSLTKRQEDEIKNRIKKECGPLVGAFLKKENLNYDIINEKFVIYYKNFTYYQFLDSSKDKIKSIVDTITTSDYEIKIVSIDKKISYKNNSIVGSENKEDSNKVVEKLEKVFGDDLIIEE